MIDDYTEIQNQLDEAQKLFTDNWETLDFPIDEFCIRSINIGETRNVSPIVWYFLKAMSTGYGLAYQHQRS